MVTVQDLSFDGNRPQPPASLFDQMRKKLEDSPVLVKYSALLLGLLMIIAFGLRPALRRVSAVPERKLLKEKDQKKRELPAGAATAAAVGAAQAATPLNPPPEPPAPDPEQQRMQEIFEQVTEHVKLEPTHASRLLQSWIHSD